MNQMLLPEVYAEVQKSCLDPLIQRTLAENLQEQLLMVIHVQLSPTQPRFNVLHARHVVEDSLEDFDRQVFSASVLSNLFQKDEKTFVKNVRCVDHVPVFLQKYKTNVSSAPIESFHQSHLVPQALQLEIQRQIDVYSKNRTPIVNIQAAIEFFKSHDEISWDNLESLMASCKLRSVLPLLAIEYAVRNEQEGLFLASFEPCIVGMPLDATQRSDVDPTYLSSIRRAKMEPSDLSRVIVAAKNHLLVCPGPDKDFVALPEPLAHQVAVVPGVDLPPDRCIVFVGCPKTKTGALVFVKIKSPSLKRIAVFDLDCDKGFNYLTSDRDSQGNILLTWGLHKNGKLVSVDHACVKEDNLVLGTSMKKQSSGTKLAFEDFGDPVERWTSSMPMKNVRFDFRDHGNLLTLDKKTPEETLVVGLNKNLLTLPYEANAIFGQPLTFVVAKNYKTLELYKAVNGILSLSDTREINNFPQTITSITCV